MYIGNVIQIDDEEQLYFKDIDENVVDDNILGLHQIGDNQLAIFTKEGTWYNVLSDGVYYYMKSKIVPTLKGDSELITLPDSTTTLMPSDDGIIALSYQNFINTNEQSTTNVTQNLSRIYKLFTGKIDNINWKFYTLFYQRGINCLLILDNRNGSWWKWELPKEIIKLFIVNNKLYALCEDGSYVFCYDNNYYDEISNGEILKIKWSISSQKLHFGANNYYKHIANITLSSIQDDTNPLHLYLNVKNYRKWVNNGKEENFDYHTEIIRTYVKRLNYSKVCEFQYLLSSDDEAVGNIPLALSGITIKYKIGGQVR